MSFQQNRKLIEDGFERWANNKGLFFDLLDENVEWIITGNGPLSKTYTSRKQFLQEAIAPISARLSKQITPKIRSIYSDGDTVIVIWDGTSTAKDGKPYNNTYAWVMTIKNGHIIKAIAFFDTIALADLWKRIPI
jgi:ketosteroid isomerase-like protein